MGRKRAIAVVAITMSVMVGGWSSTTAQDDAGADPVCALLTVAEVSEVLGEPADPPDGGIPGSCWWTAGEHTFQVYVEPSGSSRTLDELRERATDEVELDIAGHPAIYSPGSHVLFVETDDGGRVDVQSGFPYLDREVLVALAELAVPRVAAIAVPTLTSAPSFAGDLELEAMFPTEVGGEAVTVTSVGGRDLAAQSQPEQVELFNQALAQQGKTIDDVSLARASTSVASIVALRVRGADATALADGLISVLFSMVSDPQQTRITVAGKEVIRITSGPLPSADDPTQARQVVYPSDDVLWVIAAAEPELSEILGKLP
jgi:hypothetical protein